MSLHVQAAASEQPLLQKAVHPPHRQPPALDAIDRQQPAPSPRLTDPRLWGEDTPGGWPGTGPGPGPEGRQPGGAGGRGPHLIPPVTPRPAPGPKLGSLGDHPGGERHRAEPWRYRPRGTEAPAAPGAPAAPSQPPPARGLPLRGRGLSRLVCIAPVEPPYWPGEGTRRRAGPASLPNAAQRRGRLRPSAGGDHAPFPAPARRLPGDGSRRKLCPLVGGRRPP